MINRNELSRVEIYPSMIKSHKKTDVVREKPEKRREISGFTPAARKRMIEFLHSVEFEGGLLVTLTYPADYPKVAAEYHAHLKKFRRCIEKDVGRPRIVWKLEFQTRGAPHFHLLWMDKRFIAIDYLSRIWHRIVKSQDENHLKAGVDVKSAWNEDGIKNVGAYVTKYLEKDDEQENHDDITRTGRFWGHWNIIKEKPIIANLDREDALKFMVDEMDLEDYRPKRSKFFTPLSMTLFCGVAGSVTAVTDWKGYNWELKEREIRTKAVIRD